VLYSHTDIERVTEKMVRRLKTVMRSDSNMIFRVCVYGRTTEQEKRARVSRERQAAGKTQALTAGHCRYSAPRLCILLQEKWSKIDGEMLSGTNQRMKDDMNRLKLCMLNAAVKCF
jgi:sugar diacid utilization regulator